MGILRVLLSRYWPYLVGIVSFPFYTWVFSHSVTVNDAFKSFDPAHAPVSLSPVDYVLVFISSLVTTCGLWGASHLGSIFIEYAKAGYLRKDISSWWADVLSDANKNKKSSVTRRIK